MKDQIQFKLVPQFVKSIDGRTVDGIFSVFDVRDEYDDIVHKGSFTKTIQERSGDVLHLWQHDFYSPPTATIEKLAEIERAELPELIRAKYPEASGGAMVRRTYIESARGDEVLAAIKAGSPLQMSYGYDAIRYEFEELEDGDVVRHLREQRLWETSDVLWGANQATQASKILRPSIPIETLLGQMDRWLTAVKEGRRNASKDMERINKIAILALELGADSVILAPADSDEDEDKSALNEVVQAAIEEAANKAERKQREAGDESPVVKIILDPEVEEIIERKIGETLAFWQKLNDAETEPFMTNDPNEYSIPSISSRNETAVDADKENVDNKSAEPDEEPETDLKDGEETDQRRAVDEDLTLTLIGNRLDLLILEAG